MALLQEEQDVAPVAEIREGLHVEDSETSEEDSEESSSSESDKQSEVDSPSRPTLALEQLSSPNVHFEGLNL